MANITYAQQSAIRVTSDTRDILSELPTACSDYFLAITPVTQPLTRYAYAHDLKIFFTYLAGEVPAFAKKPIVSWTDEDFSRVTSRDISMYLDYLSLYMDEDENAVTNGELGKMRKLSALRAFYKWLYKQERIAENVTELVDMPKRHEKPILRLEIDEVARLFDVVESGDALTDVQKRFYAHTKVRDLAMLSLFLGTGIRVSECVGLNISDLDFDLNGFLVTRKGGNQAILYFPEEVAETLKEYLVEREKIAAAPGHENALFLSIQNKRMGVRAVENMVKKYALLAAPLKKRISPHKLRSTFGTNLYHETGDIYLVADVLGHADVNTTRRHYAAMSDDKRRMAAKAIKLRTDDSKPLPTEDVTPPNKED